MKKNTHDRFRIAMFANICLLFWKLLIRIFFFVKHFEKFVYSFASKARSKGKMGFYIERLVNYLNREIIFAEQEKKGVWCKSVGGKQFVIFEYLLENIIVQPLDYLEFGVYRGESINWWLNKLGSDSNLYGFDSFEGLNDDWYFGCPKGTFRVGSEPSIVAPNIRFC